VTAPSRYTRGTAVKSRRYLPLIALGLLPFIWGYSWIPLKIGVTYCPPYTFAALRSLPGGLILLTLVGALGRPVRPKAFWYMLGIGVLQTGGFVGLTIAALVAGGAGRTSILANTWQFWILLMAWPLLSERVRGSQWLSVGLAVVGLVLIVEPWKLHGVLSALLALAGAVCMAAGSVLVKLMRRRHEVDVLSLTAWSTLLGALPLVLVAVFAERQLPVWSTAFSLSLAYALLVSTCVAVFLWLFVLNSMPAGVAGLGTMATPVMGLLFSWAQLGEQPTVVEAIGMVTILVGSAILFLRGMREAPPEPSPAEATVEEGLFAEAPVVQ
jgi:drug/metabolite transporter (DMT)-like permease